MYRILIPLILLFGLLLSTEMQPQDMVEVPDVLGLEVGDAWRKIKKTGLHMVAVPELTTEDRPGTVLKQTPEPYTRVLDTNTVYLIIAAIIDTVIQSHQLVVVPKVEGLDLLDARRTILEFGLHMVAVPEINVEYPLGTVLKQTPEPGKQVLDTTTVYLNIAAINDLVKQFQDTVRVPNVKGLDLREARRTIFDNGLYMVAVPEITIEYLLGTVFEQDPEPGSQVSLNTTVYLKVATISEMVDVPDVVGQLLENARDSLQSIRLLFSTYQAVTTEHPPGTVIEQSPVSGSKVRTGTTIFLKIAQEEIVATFK